jgi:hypothetical protein
VTTIKPSGTSHSRSGFRSAPQTFFHAFVKVRDVGDRGEVGVDSCEELLRRDAEVEDGDFDNSSRLHGGVGVE